MYLILQGIRDIADGQADTICMSQIKMQLKIAQLLSSDNSLSPLLSEELAMSIHSRARIFLDELEDCKFFLIVLRFSLSIFGILALGPHIKEYLQNQKISTNNKKVLRNLAAYLTFYNIPPPSTLKGCHFLHLLIVDI